MENSEEGQQLGNRVLKTWNKLKDLEANSLSSNASNSTAWTPLTTFSKTLLNMLALLKKFKARIVIYFHITCVQFWKISTENICGELHSNLSVVHSLILGQQSD